MSLDLDNLLRDWPHEPGQIKVRKIQGDDGTEKLQMRLDLGLIQMNLTGRPDGTRPYDCESLLEMHTGRAAEREAAGETYTLSDDDCTEIQQEAIQYYHRYVALFQIEEFEGVVRDTEHNLGLLDLIEKHSDRDEPSFSLQQVRPYVIMMNTRARASLHLARDEFAVALEEIEQGINRIKEFYIERDTPELFERSQEANFLSQWRDEVKSSRPRTKIEELQDQMNEAIAAEVYERAAQLRDAIRAQQERR